MIWNIIDNRQRRYRWAKINAIAEATSHDNSVKDTDIAPPSSEEVVYEQQQGISVADAIRWATALPGGVTLYLYDEGAGTI